MNYYVTWDIEVEADTPVEAAKMAREIQLDRDSIATIFKVNVPYRTKPVTIDLEDE